MAESIESGKKLEYINTVCEFLDVAKKNTIKTVDEISAVANEARVACADRVYNVIADVANAQLEVISTAGDGLVKLAESLQKGNSVGPALVAGAKKAEDECAPLAAKTEDIPRISDAVIDERGLDENWTNSMQTKFTDACRAFIQVRANLMRDVADATAKLKTADFGDVYMSFGRKLEGACNEVTDKFNGTMDVFAAAGINIDKMQEDARASTSSVGKVDMSNIGNIDEV